jgi:hypothetical protein
VSGRVVVFGPSAPRDAALENSRWIAARHAEHLGEDAILVVDDGAVRAALEAAVAVASVEGVALCGHGDGGKDVFVLHNQHHEHDEAWHRRYRETSEHGAVYGSNDEPALDHDNVGLTGGRWVHILACEVGLSAVPERASSLGAVAVASYDQRLVTEFTVSSLPASAAAILGRIATMTTVRLTAREFDRDALAVHVRRASGDLFDWFDSDEGTAWTEGAGLRERMGLAKFAMQLSSALCVVRQGA